MNSRSIYFKTLNNRTGTTKTSTRTTRTTPVLVISPPGTIIKGLKVIRKPKEIRVQTDRVQTDRVQTPLGGQHPPRGLWTLSVWTLSVWTLSVWTLSIWTLSV